MLARLKRFFDLRPGEAVPVLLVFVYIAVVLASYILAKSVRSGLFLKQYGPYALAYVYAAVPAVLSIFVPVYTRIAARFGQRAVIIGSLLFFCTNVLGFYYAFRAYHLYSLPFIFYIWVNCYGIIAPVQVWTLANSLFDTRQARRLFGLIGSGASVGAIVGGLLGSVLIGPMKDPVSLLLVFALLIAMAAGIVLLSVRWIPRKGLARRGTPIRVPFRETLALVGRTRYLRLITGIVFLVAIATQWTGFQLQFVLHDRFGDNASAITQFSSRFNFSLGIVAFAVQLLLTGAALRRFGLALTLLVLPIALGGGTAMVLLLPGFWSVMVTNSFDQGLRFSVDKASYELLYLPIPPGVRTNVKATIDIIGNRVADACGGVILGLATGGFVLPGLGLELRGTAAINLVVIAIWAVVAFQLRRAYVDAIHDSIHQHRLDSERASAQVLERSAAEILAEKLASPNVKDVVYALDLLQAQNPPASGPSVRVLLTHRDPIVRRRALGVLVAANDSDAAPEVEPLLRDADLETRTEALLYLARVTGIDPLKKVQELGDFRDFSIRAGMVAYLASPGTTQNIEAARAILDAMVRDRDQGGRRARLEAARLLPRLPDEFDGQLALLLGDDDPDVRLHAIRAAGVLRKAAFAPTLIDALGDAALGAEAAASLARLGDGTVSLLRQRLFDEQASLEVRREIPAVLVRIGSAAAQGVLVESLLQSDPTLRYRIISSLNKLRRLHPDVRLDPHIVEVLLAAEITGHYRSYQVLSALGNRLKPEDAVVQGLSQSMEQEVERIFRLMSLLFPDTDLQSAYFGLRSANALVRANALEFLDNVLNPQLRNLLVPLLDSQVPVSERVAIANRLVGAPVESVEQAVGTLLASEDAWLRSCAAYAAGALNLHALAPEIERLESDPDPLLRETARVASRRLTGQPEAAQPQAPAASGEWEAGTIGVG